VELQGGLKIQSNLVTVNGLRMNTHYSECLPPGQFFTKRNTHDTVNLLVLVTVIVNDFLICKVVVSPGK